MTLDELLIELGFEYDDEGLQQFKSDVESTSNQLKTLATYAVGAATAISALVFASTASSDEMGKMADEVGVAVGEIDALQYALVRSGGTADGMSNSLRNLSRIASEAARGVGGGVEAFALLGVNVSDANGNLRPTVQLMSEVADSIRGLSRSRQLELIDRLGLSDSIRLLQQGSVEIRNLTNEARALGVVTEEDAKVAAEFQDSMTDVWAIIKDVSRLIATALAPMTTELINNFSEWYKLNREIISENLPEYIEKLVLAVKYLIVATAAWIGMRLAMHLMQLISLMRGLTVATLLFNFAAAAIPMLIGAAIAALVLLIQDAKTFFEGGESYIGDMIEKFPTLEGAIRGVAFVLNGVWEITSMIIDGWKEIFALFNRDTLSKAFEGAKEAMATLIPAPIRVAASLGQEASEIGSGTRGWLTGLLNMRDRNSIDQNQIQTPRSSQISVDRLEIIVQGSADPAQTAREVMNQFQQSSKDLQTAVDM